MAALSTARIAPDPLFNTVFIVLLAGCVGLKVATREGRKRAAPGAVAPDDAPTKDMSDLRYRYLIVFWLFKMADWLQGPYFYDVYASKTLNGEPLSTAWVARIFLTGFGTAALLGATTGRLVDAKGRKAGSLAFAAFYAFSALSTRFSGLPILLAGRVAGGIGTSLLFCAPEAWLVSEHERRGHPPTWLSGTFGAAYLGDSIVAILAGQFAGAVASKGGPTAPFMLSEVFLLLGAAIAAATWGENTAGGSSSSGSSQQKSAVWEACKLMRADPRILCVGAVQALFEGAMYIFVMQWPPALMGVLAEQQVPFGKVFSCLMAACMIGSSLFGPLIRIQSVEKVTGGMLAVAALSMALATVRTTSLAGVVASFLAFEACVGLYFPAIGTLRSKYLPDSHRSVLMSMFRVPLNVIVAVVMLSVKWLGLKGSLASTSLTLFVACMAQVFLCSKQQK